MRLLRTVYSLKRLHSARVVPSHQLLPYYLHGAGRPTSRQFVGTSKRGIVTSRTLADEFSSSSDTITPNFTTSIDPEWQLGEFASQPADDARPAPRKQDYISLIVQVNDLRLSARIILQ